MAENNGSLAEVQLTVAIDKKKYFNQLKKMFQDSQTECDNNKLTVTFQSDRVSIENIIKQLDSYDFSANVTLESNVAEFKGHLEDVLAHMDMSVPVTADTSALDKKLAEEENKLEELKKKQRKSSAELSKELETLFSKTTDKNFDKNAKKALQYYNALKAAGGNIRSVKDQKVRDFITEAQRYAEYVEFAKQHPLTFVDEAEIQAQIKVIEDLKQEIEKTKQATRENGTATGAGGNGSAKVGTEPDVNAEEFAKKVSEQLTVPAKIEVTGVVSDPEKFAKDIADQLNVPVNIEVEPLKRNVSNSSGQNNTGENIPLTLDALRHENQIRDESNEVLKEFNASLKDTAAYLYDVNNQEERMILLQGKSQVGETFVQNNGHVGVPLNLLDALKPDTIAHSHQFDKAFNNLRFSTDDLVQATTRDFINRLVLSCGDQMLELDFRGIKPEQKAQMIQEMTDTYTSVFALFGASVNNGGTIGNPKASLVSDVYNQAVEVINSMMYKIAEKYGSNFSQWNAPDFGDEYKNIPFTPLNTTIANYVDSMRLALGGGNLNGIGKLQADFSKILLAGNAIQAEGKAAKEAAKWKKEFAKANKVVAQASKETAEETKEAAKGVEAEGEASKEAAQSTREFQENADLLRYLKDIQQGTNTVQFGISIDKEMAEAELKRIAPEIADAFNKQYGTNLTGIQVVKAYKAALKEQQAADEKALQDHLEYLEKRTQADDVVFQKQIHQWSDYIQKTAEKRKEADEQRQIDSYNDAMGDAMAYANQQAADELEYQQKLAEYKAQGAAQIQEIIKEEKEHAAWVEEVCKKQEESNALMQKQLDEAEQLAVYDMAMEYANSQAEEEAEYLKKRNEYLEYGRQQQEEYLRQAQDIAKTFNNADKAQETSSTQHNKEAAKAYDKLFSSAKEYYNLLMKQESGSLSANESARLAELKGEWNAATQAVGKYAIETDGTADSINRATAAQARFNNEAQNYSVNGVLKNLQSSYDKIQNMIVSGKYTSAFIVELSEVQSQIREIMNTPLDLDDEALRGKLARLRGTIDETIGKKAFSDVKKAASSSLSKLELQINEFTNQNTGMGLRFRQQFENLRIRLTDAKSVADVEKLAASITKLKSEVESAGRATRSFFDILRERIVGINAQAIAQYFSWQDWIRYIRQMATTVTQLDTALTEMRKVSDDSLTSLQAYQRTTFETADAVGTTALALQQSTADWMRLGEAQAEAAKSAQAATVLMNVSEFQSIDEATQSLVAVSQAYKDIDKMDIIDVINNIGNNYSVATNELAQGLQNAAAVLKTQGNDLNEAVALLTAGNAITQDISKTSAGIRTISLRIAGTQEAKDQLAELGEEVDDFVVQTESKTQKLIKDYTAVASNAYQGIDVLDANGNLRNTYDILLDIARIYKEIQDEDLKAGTNRAQALVEYIAGKNRSNIAASILLNPDMLENVYNSALDSTGSAERELAKYLESIEGHIARFQTQLQELEFDFLDSDTIKTAINLGTGVLSLIDSLVDRLGMLGTLGTAAAIAAATRNFGGAKSCSHKIRRKSGFPYGYISFLMTKCEIHMGKTKRQYAGNCLHCYYSPTLMWTM